MRRPASLIISLLLLLAACQQDAPPAASGGGEEPAAPALENCGAVAEEEDLGADHLQPGEPLPPDSPQPAASGPHSGSPLPAEPHVYFEPVDEAQAVHNLEHGYVLIYYMAETLRSEVLEALSALAESEVKVIMAPYDLGRDTALAFVAWTRMQTCGPAVSVEEASGAATTFIAAFRAENGVAPEPGAP